MSLSFLPGQKIDDSLLGSAHTIGCGFEKRNNELFALQPGLFRKSDEKAWLNVQSKRYIPQEGDCVIGVVHSKQGDLFKIDIGSADLANINFLSFEGATKRNRPSLKTGDLIFARVQQASRHLEPELTCVDQYNRAKGLGLISSSSGLFFKVSLHLARRLLSSQCPLLGLLGKEFKFEITVGINGRVWINGSEPKNVVAIRKIILGAEYIVDGGIADFVEKQIRKHRGFNDLSMETS